MRTTQFVESTESTGPAASAGSVRPAQPTTAAAVVLAAALLLSACGDGGSGGDGSGGGTDDRGDAACRVAEVGVGVEPSPAPAAGDTGTVSVTLTNRGPSCVLHGFPTVTLNAGDASVRVPREEAATPQRLTLGKQDTASFTVAYVRGGDDGTGEPGDADGTSGTDATGGLTVRSVEFALPDDASTHRFPWSYGTVATKGEGRPDATAGAFQRAGD